MMVTENETLPLDIEPAAAAEVVADAPVADAPVVETAAESVAADAPAAEAAEAPVSEPTLLEQTESPGQEKAATEEEAKAADSDADAEAEVEAKGDDEAEAKDEAKAEEAKEPDAEDADAASEAADAESAAPEPIDYKYELPESLTMDDDQKTATHAAFDAFRADPTNPQPLIDLHHEAMQRHETNLRKQQWDVFNDTRKEWRDSVLSDEEIGGAGHRTAMQAIARMRDRFASSAKPGTKAYEADSQAFDGMLRATGVGDHPVFLKMMHRVAQLYDEPAMGPTNVTPAPQKQGVGVLYDNPRSQKSGRA